MPRVCLERVRSRVRNATRPSFYQLARRIAKRLEPDLARAFMSAVEKYEKFLDADAIKSALASGNFGQIEAAVASSRLGAILLGDPKMFDTVLSAATLTGSAGADVLEGVLGVSVQFNARDPATVLAARTQTANLIQQVQDEVKEVVRIITTMGADFGLTVDRQARMIRSHITMMPQHAAAPFNLRQNIIDGREYAATARRLSAVDKAAIRKAIRTGVITDQFLDDIQERYARSLVNYRAITIARTETLRASHLGQREGWVQARDQGALPTSSRRFWLVTPDERLSEDHAAIPAMNPEGRLLDEPFQTPVGTFYDPPIRPNCRCGTGLGFPGLVGIL